MTKAKSLHTRDFMGGFAMAVADLVRQADHPSIAAGLIAGHGFRLSDFDDCDPYDRTVIAELYRTESQLRRIEGMHRAAEILVSSGLTRIDRGPKISLKEAADLANTGTVKQRVTAHRKRLRKKYPSLRVK